MKVHELFPVALGQDMLDCHEEFRNEYLEEIKKIQSIQTIETSLHLNIRYINFFKSFRTSIQKYLILLGIDSSKVNLHISKTWIENSNQENFESKLHKKNASDITFCYYLESDENSHKVCFHPSQNHNEISGGLFDYTGENAIISQANKYNCDTYAISPIEGSIIFFPSKLNRTILRRDETYNSCAIVGTVNLTLKPQDYQYSQSISHPTQWLDLERF